MKISVIGAGGVGGYFGGKLAHAGNDVTFVARGESLWALKNNGLTVKSINGDFKVEKVNVTDNFREISGIDLIMIGVKAWQLKEIAIQLKPVIADHTVVLPLQNGVMAVEELQEVLPAKNIISGLCRIISKIEAPGVINHFGVDPVIIFGETDNSKSHRIEKIREVFEQSGINAQVPGNIQSELWKKFITICVSGLLAVSKTTYGELRELPETRQMMIDLFNEVYQLSQKLNIPIKPDFVAKTVAFIDSFPYETTSSLTRDVLEGKPSEIEYQNGTVVKLGKKYGVDTPVNRFVYGCILPMENRARMKK
jgi:2-dehydropantoate 2-reductase